MVWQQNSPPKPATSLPKEVLALSPLNRTEVHCLRRALLGWRQESQSSSMPGPPLPLHVPSWRWDGPSVPAFVHATPSTSTEQTCGASGHTCHLYVPPPPRLGFLLGPEPWCSFMQRWPYQVSRLCLCTSSCENVLLEDTGFALFLDPQSSAQGSPE